MRFVTPILLAIALFACAPHERAELWHDGVRPLYYAFYSDTADVVRGTVRDAVTWANAVVGCTVFAFDAELWDVPIRQGACYGGKLRHFIDGPVIWIPGPECPQNQKLVIHELMHGTGLGHDDDNTSIMSPIIYPDAEIKPHHIEHLLKGFCDS